jgi:hypothetical protein
LSWQQGPLSGVSVGRFLTPEPLPKRKTAAWPYLRAWPEVARVSNFVSFGPDVIDVFLDDKKLSLEAGQGVKEHGIDRSLDPEEMLKRGNALAYP